MKRIMHSRTLYRLLRLVIGGVFIYAGALKLADPDAFARAIDGYGLVSWGAAKLLARVLPVVEIVSGAGLVLNLRGALGLVVAQLLVFMGVIAYAIHMGYDVDCGCFGPSEGEGGAGALTQTMFRDLIMLAACLFMYWQRRTSGVLPRSPLRYFSGSKEYSR
jgi:uncharacterized membrane protein YphA (DoxX/SURF4 family)